MHRIHAGEIDRPRFAPESRNQPELIILGRVLQLIGDADIALSGAAMAVKPHTQLSLLMHCPEDHTEMLDITLIGIIVPV